MVISPKRNLLIFMTVLALLMVACRGNDDNGGSSDNRGGGDVALAAYPNSDVMASVEYAASLRENPDVRFVDLRSAEDYAASHIIEAVNADPTQFGYGTNALPDRGAVEGILRGWGVSDDTTIILYDESTTEAATWVFWVLETYGHNNLRIMNGGFLGWRAEERSLVLDVPQFSASNYSLSNADSDRFANADWVNDNRDRSNVVVLDARTPEEYQGIEGGGHIPGAVNITGSLAYSSGEVRDANEIIDLFDGDALDGASTVVVYDVDGTVGSMTYFALRVAGKNARLYLGGWSDWLGRGLSVATGIE